MAASCMMRLSQVVCIAMDLLVLASQSAALVAGCACLLVSGNPFLGWNQKERGCAQQAVGVEVHFPLEWTACTHMQNEAVLPTPACESGTRTYCLLIALDGMQALFL
jgi:hypothetical protein